MRILWITNILMPEALAMTGQTNLHIGGWMTGYQEVLLSSKPDARLHVVAPWDNADTQSLTGASGTVHHLFPQAWVKDYLDNRKSATAQTTCKLCQWMKQIHAEIQPDVIHIHGTELPHSRAWVETNGAVHTVVSVQGLISVAARYMLTDIPQRVLRPTFHDWRFNGSIPAAQRRQHRDGQLEVELLRQVDHIAGRTSWDRAHVCAIHPEAYYYHLDEVLRREFYEASGWRLDRCQRHTLLVTKTLFPYQGFHKLLQALPLVIARYPDTQVRALGFDMTGKKWWQESSYQRYLRQLTEAGDLHGHVTYLGRLNASQMVAEYCRAHVYCSASAIENSSNSVCEAQILGTPVISSYVGGLMDFIVHRQSGMLYRYEEVEMLADLICQIFADDDLATTISEGARTLAKARHDRQTIANALSSIYQAVAGPN